MIIFFFLMLQIILYDNAFIYIDAGELFFITDRRNGFWNLYKWVSSMLGYFRF